MKNIKSKVIIISIITVIIAVILFAGHNLITMLIKMHGG
jgi:hypothetical protein